MMKPIVDMVSGFLRIVLSVPIFVKVIGIGAIVAVIFGTVTLYVTHGASEDFFLQTNELRLAIVSQRLARGLESGEVPVEDSALQFLLESTVQGEGGCWLAAVLDGAEGRPIAQADVGPHSFPAPWNPGLEPDEAATAPVDEIVHRRAEKLLGGLGGTLVVILHQDPKLRAQAGGLGRSVLNGLALSVALGISLAFLLTHLLTYPIHQLKAVAERIGNGEFEARTHINRGDEIGSLALTVNQMGQSLETYREEVREKHALRASLIDKIVRATEDERKTVARELHDQLGQSLSTTLLKLQQTSSDSESNGAWRGDLEDDLRSLIDDVQRLARDLRPPVLDDYGLESALSQLVDQISNQLGIPNDFQLVDSSNRRRLSPSIEISLYRITQEALTNVVRHAKAEHVSVILMYQEEEVSLVIEDDGCGFDLDSPSSGNRQSLGLLGMRERVEFAGGKIEFETEPGRGTGIFVRIPYEGNENVH